MKMILADQSITLDTSLPYEERNKFIKELLNTELQFYDGPMTVEEYFRFTWNKTNSKTCMDIISYYLTKGNTEGEDREVISNGKMKEMKKGSKRHTTFSSMGYADQVAYGLIDPEEYEY